MNETDIQKQGHKNENRYYLVGLPVVNRELTLSFGLVFCMLLLLPPLLGGLGLPPPEAELLRE